MTTETQLLAAIAGLSAVGASLFLSAARRPLGRHAWLAPAAASALFLALSIRAVALESPVGFWPEHTRNQWGVQIWCDLLLAAVAALAVMIPRARDAGMRVLPWVLLTLATGSIGLYAMLARLLYLERRGRPHGSDSGSPSATNVSVV